VYFRDEDDGVVAGIDGLSVAVARTTDGGATWKTGTVKDPAVSPAGYSDITMSFGDDSDGAILARTATSQAFSVGTLFATTDGGASWSVHPAPEAGVLSVDSGGRTWVAGTALNTTSDRGRTWTTSAVQVGDATGTATLSTPVQGTLPVTVSDGDSTTVELLTSGDGGQTWASPQRLAVHARTGPGVRLPVARSGNGLLVFDTVAGHAYRAGSDLRPSGLPDGVVHATFADSGDAGWALASYGTCASGKTGCVLHHDLVSTANGGTSWRGVAAWSTPAN
jgi:hypothetical protein